MPTIPNWPDELPAMPLYNGYQELFPRTVLRTNMDSGPVKVRRRYTANVRPLKVKYHLTLEQTEILDLFFNEVAEGGAVAFLWVVPRTGAEALTRFSAEPRVVPLAADVWMADLELEILPS